MPCEQGVPVGCCGCLHLPEIFVLSLQCPPVPLCLCNGAGACSLLEEEEMQLYNVCKSCTFAKSRVTEERTRKNWGANSTTRLKLLLHDLQDNFSTTIFVLHIC